MGVKLGLSHWLTMFKNRVLRKICDLRVTR